MKALYESIDSAIAALRKTGIGNPTVAQGEFITDHAPNGRPAH